jgi:acyl-CoA thioester hydrolase
MSLFTFSMRKRVRWAEVDPQQVVFNPNYLTYADIGITEYLRAIGMPFPNPLAKEGTDIFAVRSEVNFRSPARFDDEIDIRARTARIGRTSFTMAFEIARDGELLADIVTVYANADVAAARSVPLPQRMIDRIIAFEGTPPERA